MCIDAGFDTVAVAVPFLFHDSCFYRGMFVGKYIPSGYVVSIYVIVVRSKLSAPVPSNSRRAEHDGVRRTTISRPLVCCSLAARKRVPLPNRSTRAE